jgi:hypothetical protein
VGKFERGEPFRHTTYILFSKKPKTAVTLKSKELAAFKWHQNTEKLPKYWKAAKASLHATFLALSIG